LLLNCFGLSLHALSVPHAAPVVKGIRTMTLTRRATLATALAVPLIASPGVARPARADTVVRMGTLKLIHSITPYFYDRFLPDGLRVEVVPFESPSDGKNAVVSGSVDFGTFGIAASILSVAAHEPLLVVGSMCNKGMAIVAGAASGIATIRDLKGRRVAIWPGSTQEVFALERLRMEGMSVHDITPVRVSFSEMHAALARGDVDAYVGAEPAPSVSLSTGVGRIVEYPYSTAMGSLNMVIATHRDTAAQRPELVRALILLQRKASEFATAHPDEMTAMTVARLGQKRDAIALALPNVELNWRMTPGMIAQCRSYGDHMLELKQIRSLPDYAFLDTTFSDEVARSS
jgi:ABC-type nitrate/sulfonate/bicarbonate transport system substrate-binding protein